MILAGITARCLKIVTRLTITGMARSCTQPWDDDIPQKCQKFETSVAPSARERRYRRDPTYVDVTSDIWGDDYVRRMSTARHQGQLILSTSYLPAR